MKINDHGNSQAAAGPEIPGNNTLPCREAPEILLKCRCQGWKEPGLCTSSKFQVQQGCGLVDPQEGAATRGGNGPGKLVAIGMLGKRPFSWLQLSLGVCSAPKSLVSHCTSREVRCTKQVPPRYCGCHHCPRCPGQSAKGKPISRVRSVLSGLLTNHYQPKLKQWAGLCPVFLSVCFVLGFQTFSVLFFFFKCK